MSNQNDMIVCPFCRGTLGSPRSAICPKCGLWWVPFEGGQHEEIRGGSKSVFLPDSVLMLRGAFHLLGWTAFILFGLFGYWAALVAVGVVYRGPAAWTDWAKFGVGVLLGGSVGTFCAAVVLRGFLRALVPARLEDAGSTLRLKVWTDLGSMRYFFRRTDVAAPWEELKGVAIRAGQGGWDVNTQLVVIHSSGLTFGTGWFGRKSVALQHGARLASWINSKHERRLE